MEIAGLKIGKADYARIATPLENDLIAYYTCAMDASLELVEQALREGWPPEQLVTEIDMLFDGTADIIEYQNEVLKARKLAGIDNPNVAKAVHEGGDGSIRKWGDGYYHLKLPNGKWILAHDPNGRNGAAKNNELYAKHKADAPGGGAKRPAKPVDPDAGKYKRPGGPVVDKPSKEHTADRANRERKEWLDDNEAEFDRELAHQINAEHPHPLLDTAKIVDMVRGMPDEEKLAHAEKHKIEKPVDFPDDWDKKDWEEKFKENKKLFVREIIAARFGAKVKGDEAKQVAARYMKLDWPGLNQRAVNNIGRDLVAIKRRADAAAAHDKAMNEILKKAVTSKDQYKRPAIEMHLAEAPLIDHVPLGKGMNGAEKAVLKTPSGKLVSAIWKARNKESKGDAGFHRYGNFPAEMQWHRERLAYVVNDIIGLNNSPEVVIREVPGEGIGAMMQFIPDAKDWATAGASYSDFPKVEWQKLTMHAWLLCATDMYGANFMADKKTKKLYAIDNGLVIPEERQFGEYTGYRCHPHKYLYEHDDLEVLPEVMDFLTPEKKAKVLQEIKDSGVGEKGQKIVEWRWDYIVKHKKFPKYEGGDFMRNIAGVV